MGGGGTAAATSSRPFYSDIDRLSQAAANDRRIQRFVKAMVEPLDRFTRALQLVVAAAGQQAGAAASVRPAG